MCKHPIDLDLEGVDTVAIDIETYDPNLKTKGLGAIRQDGFITGVAVATGKDTVYFSLKHSDDNNTEEEQVGQESFDMMTILNDLSPDKQDNLKQQQINEQITQDEFDALAFEKEQLHLATARAVQDLGNDGYVHLDGTPPNAEPRLSPEDNNIKFNEDLERVTPEQTELDADRQHGILSFVLKQGNKLVDDIKGAIKLGISTYRRCSQ